jgi:hypothetical protein
VVRFDGVRGLLLLAGLTLLAVVVAWAGVGQVKEALSQVADVVPLLVLCEGARMPLEALMTRVLLGSAVRRLPGGVLLRAQAVFYAVSTVVPGGRLVGELSKVALLAPHVGRLRAAAVAGASQATSFFADALLGVVAAVVAIVVLGYSAVSGVLVLFAVTCLVLGVFVVRGMRSGLPKKLVARFPRVLRAATKYRRVARAQRMIVPRAVLLLFVARLFQVAFITIAFQAVGAGLSPALGTITLALNMMASAIGDAIPGQVGPTDAALALSAPALGMTAAVMVSVSVVIHAVQLGWAAAFGAVGLFMPRPGSSRGSEGARDTIA